MRIGLVVAMAMVAVAVAACGAEDGGGSLEQGIEGRYVITGPGMISDCTELPRGEERDACEASNEPWMRPVAAAEIEVRDSAGQPVTRVVTDTEGAFRVQLPEGDYLLCDAGCDGPITVTAGEFTFYEITLAVP